MTFIVLLMFSVLSFSDFDNCSGCEPIIGKTGLLLVLKLNVAISIVACCILAEAPKEC